MRPVTEITLWEMRMELYFPLISQRSCATAGLFHGWRVAGENNIWAFVGQCTRYGHFALAIVMHFAQLLVE